MYKVTITGVDTSKLKTLTNEEMEELLLKVKEGNKEARDKLILGNLKLILSILKKFNNKKELLDDLFQIGVIGLMKAVDNFDITHNVKFSTYAVPMIIGEIKRYLRDNSLLRISRSLKDIAYKSIKVKEDFYIEHKREPTIEEIAKILECDPIDVLMSYEAIQDPLSIYQPVYDNGIDKIELIDKINSKEKIIDNWEKNKLIRLALAQLKGREKDIIKERYFLNKTQNEIALELGISQAQVSRIEKNALKTMYEKIK